MHQIEQEMSEEAKARGKKNHKKKTPRGVTPVADLALPPESRVSSSKSVTVRSIGRLGSIKLSAKL